MAPEVSGEEARRGGVVGCRALLFVRVKGIGLTYALDGHHVDTFLRQDKYTTTTTAMAATFDHLADESFENSAINPRTTRPSALIPASVARAPTELLPVRGSQAPKE